MVVSPERTSSEWRERASEWDGRDSTPEGTHPAGHRALRRPHIYIRWPQRGSMVPASPEGHNNSYRPGHNGTQAGLACQAMPYSRFTLESSPQQPSPSVFPQSASSQPLSDCDSLHKPGKHSSPSHSGMLVLLLGPRCSGKETIARYLADHQHFQRVSLTSQKTSQSHHKQTATRQSALDAAKQQQQTDEGGPSDELVFDTASHFLDHATLHWRSHFVTTVRLTKSELEAFRKRPWVLLVSVEAPLTWRYARSVAK